jgi:serine/threonine protein kinase
MREKLCPTCSRSYSESFDYCEVDGKKLIFVNEEPSLVGRVIDGKFELQEVIGQGGMGTVYLGRQSSMERDVAVKVLKRRFAEDAVSIKRFMREAKAASKLQHQNTITVHDWGQTDDGWLYMVLERLHGQSLADILEDEIRLGYVRAVHIVAQICDSLSEAHGAGITHRDLKPENIFIEAQIGNPDHVKVLDFGIAKMHEEGVSQATATGMVCGTPAYMSPEQAMGHEIDGRSDVYALGILLYELVSGKQPFEGDAAMEVMLKHLNDAPPEIEPKIADQLPEGVKTAIAAMLSKKAAGRPADCQQVKSMLLSAIGATGSLELQHALAATAKGRNEQTPPPMAAERALRDAFSTDVLARAPRRPKLLALVTVVGLVAAGFAYGLSDWTERDAVGTAPISIPVRSQPTEEKPAAQGVAGKSVAEKEDKRLNHKKAEEVKERARQAANKRVSLTVGSRPNGAKIYDASGQYIGQAQLTVSRPRNSAPYELTLRLPGYQPAKVVMATLADSEVVTNLKLLLPPSKPRVDAGKEPRKRKRHVPRHRRAAAPIGSI